jgi:hypothetical protein
LSNPRFFISPTEIPLDQLNTTDLPPSDSRFHPLTLPDGSKLGASSSESELVTAEPSSFVLLLCGGAGLLAGTLRRRKKVTA